MPDNGLYDDASDSYDGDGTTSYDLSYLLVRMAMEGLLALPSWAANRLLPAYTGLHIWPSYSTPRQFISYSSITDFPTYTYTLDLRLGD